jgi:hypothetical protein
MKEFFDILGLIVNQYVPKKAQDLYELKLLKPLHIVSIADCLYSGKYWTFDFYCQLRWLKNISFNYNIKIKDLGPLKGTLYKRLGWIHIMVI